MVGGLKVLDYALLGEHLLKNLEHLPDGGCGEPAKPPEQALNVDRAELIEDHESCAVSKPTRNAPWRSVAAGRHWRHDHGTKVLVEFVRRDDEAGPGLADFASKNGI